MQTELDSLLTFYNICKQIVAGWPATTVGSNNVEDRKKRLNTFGVFRSVDDLNSDSAMKNLKYSSTDYFFSRPFFESGHNPDNLLVEYPVVGLSEVSFQFFDPLKTARRDVHRLNLIFADQIPEFNEQQQSDNEINVNDDRTVEQVGADLRTFAKSFLSVLGRWVYADVYTAPLTSAGYQWIDSLDAELNYHQAIDRTSLSEFIGADNPLSGEIVYFATDDNLAILICQLNVVTRDCSEVIELDYNYLKQVNTGKQFVAPQDY